MELSLYVSKIERSSNERRKRGDNQGDTARFDCPLAAHKFLRGIRLYKAKS